MYDLPDTMSLLHEFDTYLRKQSWQENPMQSTQTRLNFQSTLQSHYLFTYSQRVHCLPWIIF